MKINKWLVPFGMIGVLAFLLLDILGSILWTGYDPVTMYISMLVADEAPHVDVMRFFMNTYTTCFLAFSLAMVALSLYYRVVVIRAPLQGLCYTVRDAVDWLRSPTA